jgi:hypothetical protein
MNEGKEKRSQSDAKSGRGRERRVPISEDTTPLTKTKRLKEKLLKAKKVKRSSGHLTVEIQEPNHELASMKMLQAFGTPDTDLQDLLMSQVLATFRGYQSIEGPCGEDELVSFCSQALAILEGIAPRDEIEALLAAQMIGVHNVAMETMRLAMMSPPFEIKEASINQATKMQRTFVAQMEALRKYRSAGQQEITLEDSGVNNDGQAIEGTVNHGEGKRSEK